MSHPYQNLPTHQYWPQAMTKPAPGHVNPAQGSTLRIARSEPVVTLGSCFAQHLAREIHQAGFNYLVGEVAPATLDARAAQARQYGLFSARYGNIYTARQARQLLERAFKGFEPLEPVWRKVGDRYADPFRPSVEPEGFASQEDLLADRARHLEAVRAVFTRAKWVIFTLGLTEAWRSRQDGAVFSQAPGVAGCGAFDSGRHEFVNFSANEVAEDIAAFRELLREINPEANLVLTVSPVPLAATYESRHVWTSTTYSKAALRVAAEETVRRFGNAFYFPSYEIITSPAAGGRYYDDDLRSITRAGVKHVMRVFFENCVDDTASASAVDQAQLREALMSDMEILCDEEQLLNAGNAEEQALTQESFDEVTYLTLNPDVAAAVAARQFHSGWHHYTTHGRVEGRRRA
jgi:hypothetical protein